MLRKVLQRINRVFNSAKMAEILPSSVISSQDDKGTKRPIEEENSDQQKKQKTDSDEKRLPKRKVAMLIGYNGKGYYGIQINKGFKTIEDELIKALVETECIPQDHADTPQKMSFQRACRTDKGVSAARNLISVKMVIEKENLVQEINSKLSDQIRVFCIKRTTKGFDSKNFCDNRTYVYICPTYAFAPIETIVTDAYRITDDVLDNVNQILSKFKGTHKFHNYTSKVKATEAQAKRYIISISCGKPFVRDNCEFCVISLKGQSFMLHQIRKMIGITIAIVRGNCGPEVIDKSWENARVDIPKAPGLGLCLDEPHYTGYNKRYGSDGMHEPLEWSEYEEEINKFKEECIYKDIIKTEREEKVMLAWLGTLQHHEFDVCDEESMDRGWRKTRFLDKCKKNPDIFITPDLKPMMEKPKVEEATETLNMGEYPTDKKEDDDSLNDIDSNIDENLKDDVAKSDKDGSCDEAKVEKLVNIKS